MFHSELYSKWIFQPLGEKLMIFFAGIKVKVFSSPGTNFQIQEILMTKIATLLR